MVEELYSAVKLKELSWKDFFYFYNKIARCSGVFSIHYIQLILFAVN